MEKPDRPAATSRRHREHPIRNALTHLRILRRGSRLIPANSYFHPCLLKVAGVRARGIRSVTQARDEVADPCVARTRLKVSMLRTEAVVE